MTQAPRFWSKRTASPAALALWPLSRLYGALSAWRMNSPPRFRPPVPVLCVGNFVVGGAGKTPTAIALAKIARSRGLTPGFLASGYGGRLGGPVKIDPALHGPEDVGDEALLLAAVAPTVTGRDRAAAARKLLGEGVDIIIMDDGFQNPTIAKDLSLVAVDAGGGVGNGFVLPAGPLRVPLRTQLPKADALIVIGEGTAADPLIRAAARAGRAILRGRLRPIKARGWRKEPILAFAGIGRPEKFFETLKELGAPVAKAIGFPDHHPYTEAEAERLLLEAEGAGYRLLTTEKDMVRLVRGKGKLAELREKAEAFPVMLEFENQTAVGELIEEVVRKAAIRPRR